MNDIVVFAVGWASGIVLMGSVVMAVTVWSDRKFRRR